MVTFRLQVSLKDSLNDADFITGALVAVTNDIEQIIQPGDISWLAVMRQLEQELTAAWPDVLAG